MGLFRRVGDIVSANLHEMVERFEDPEKLLKQAVREMEDAVARARSEVVQVMAGEKLLQKDLAANERQTREWEALAQQAVLAGDDALARQALSRRQDHRRNSAALQDQLAAMSEASRALRRHLEGMQRKLAEARREWGVLVARKKAAAVCRQAQQGVGTPVLNQQAFEKFERLREKVERLEAEADAHRELDGCLDDGPTVVPEVAPIDLELAGLKQKLLVNRARSGRCEKPDPQPALDVSHQS